MLTILMLLVIIFNPFLFPIRVFVTCSVVVPIFNTTEELSLIISLTFSAIAIFSLCAIVCLEK